jgi:hypothetical protein
MRCKEPDDVGARVLESRSYALVVGSPFSGSDIL